MTISWFTILLLIGYGAIMALVGYMIRDVKVKTFPKVGLIVAVGLFGVFSLATGVLIGSLANPAGLASVQQSVQDAQQGAASALNTATSAVTDAGNAITSLTSGGGGGATQAPASASVSGDQPAGAATQQTGSASSGQAPAGGSASSPSPTSVAPQSSLQAPASSSSPGGGSAPASANAGGDKPPVLAVLPTIPNTSDGNSTTYTLRIGLFGDESQAASLQPKLEGNGLPTAIAKIQNANGDVWYTVTVGAFSTRSEAILWASGLTGTDGWTPVPVVMPPQPQS